MNRKVFPTLTHMSVKEEQIQPALHFRRPEFLHNVDVFVWFLSDKLLKG